MLEIMVPQHFRHPGQLPDVVDLFDPRDREPSWTAHVVIDLSSCQFLRPPGLLWCLTYALLVEDAGGTCLIRPPENTGVLQYLQRAGIFDMLSAAGVAVARQEHLPRAGEPSQLILPPLHFDSEDEAEALVESAFDALQQRDVGPGNMYWIVSDVFGELCLNAVQHSESPIGAYAMVQYYEFEERPQFSVAVADGGIGIRASLMRNDDLAGRIEDDSAALDLAVRERISGTKHRTRGIGLHTVKEEMSNPGRILLLHSGAASLELDEQTRQPIARQNRVFPGTMAYARISVPE